MRPIAISGILRSRLRIEFLTNIGGKPTTPSSWWHGISMGKQTIQSVDLDREYTITLRRYLRRGGEADLARAYELGRKGLGEGRGVLRMVALHHEAMVELMKPGHAGQALDPGAFMRASAFFSESMSSFEMTKCHVPVMRHHQ